MEDVLHCYIFSLGCGAHSPEPRKNQLSDYYGSTCYISLLYLFQISTLPPPLPLSFYACCPSSPHGFRLPCFHSTPVGYDLFYKLIRIYGFQTLPLVFCIECFEPALNPLANQTRGIHYRLPVKVQIAPHTE